MRYFEDMVVGSRTRSSRTYKVTREEVIEFATKYDPQPFHLDDEAAVDLLSRMGRASRQLVLINDLIRSPLGYGLAWVGCRLLSRSPIVHFDGPVSVQGAFRLPEVRDLAARAGLDGAVIRRSWPERYLLCWRRPDLPPQP